MPARPRPQSVCFFTLAYLTRSVKCTMERPPQTGEHRESSMLRSHFATIMHHHTLTSRSNMPPAMKWQHASPPPRITQQLMTLTEGRSSRMAIIRHSPHHHSPSAPPLKRSQCFTTFRITMNHMLRRQRMRVLRRRSVLLRFGSFWFGSSCFVVLCVESGRIEVFMRY